MSALCGRVGSGVGMLRRQHRNAAGLKHRARFGQAQHAVAIGQRAAHDCANRRGVGPMLAQQCGWGLGQFGLIVPVPRQHGKGAYGLFGRVEVGDVLILKGLARLRRRLVAKPARQHPWRGARFMPRQGRQGVGNFGAGHCGRGRVDEQHGTAVRRLLQQAQCLFVARHRRITQDVDRVAALAARWQHGIEFLPGRRAEFRQIDAGIGRRLGGDDSGTAVIGEDRYRVVRVGTKT